MTSFLIEAISFKFVGSKILFALSISTSLLLARICRAKIRAFFLFCEYERIWLTLSLKSQLVHNSKHPSKPFVTIALFFVNFVRNFVGKVRRFFASTLCLKVPKKYVSTFSHFIPLFYTLYIKYEK